MDIEFGPDGALYVLEYGDGFFAENPEAQLARIDFVRGNCTPVPKVTAAEPTTGLAPLTVQLLQRRNDRPGRRPARYEWDFDADGRSTPRAPNPTFTYTENGVFDATLKVTDRTGRSAAASVQIIVGNTRAGGRARRRPAPGEPFALR